MFQIRIIDCKQEVPHDGAICDLRWPDPEDIVDGWGLSPRGEVSYLVGGSALHLITRIILTTYVMPINW